MKKTIVLKVEERVFAKGTAKDQRQEFTDQWEYSGDADSKQEVFYALMRMFGRCTGMAYEGMGWTFEGKDRDSDVPDQYREVKVRVLRGHRVVKSWRV